MPQNEKNLVWIDCEMTGLDPQTDEIIEIAAIITDSHLNVVAESKPIAIHQPSHVLDEMDEWNTTTHTRSGLVDRIKDSSYDTAQAEREILEFVSEHVPQGISPFCGNSVHQDRFFMRRLMPQLEAYLHYRNLDVSSLKILVERWAPYMLGGLDKKARHLALDDIRESIQELRFYRDNFLNYLPDPINR